MRDLRQPLVSRSTTTSARALPAGSEGTPLRQGWTRTCRDTARRGEPTVVEMTAAPPDLWSARTRGRDEQALAALSASSCTARTALTRGRWAGRARPGHGTPRTAVRHGRARPAPSLRTEARCSRIWHTSTSAFAVRGRARTTRHARIPRTEERSGALRNSRWARSSVGQSRGLIIPWSLVRIQAGLPTQPQPSVPVSATPTDRPAGRRRTRSAQECPLRAPRGAPDLRQHSFGFSAGPAAAPLASPARGLGVAAAA